MDNQNLNNQAQSSSSSPSDFQPSIRTMEDDLSTAGSTVSKTTAKVESEPKKEIKVSGVGIKKSSPPPNIPVAPPSSTPTPEPKKDFIQIKRQAERPNIYQRESIEQEKKPVSPISEMRKEMDTMVTAAASTDIEIEKEKMAELNKASARATQRKSITGNLIGVLVIVLILIVLGGGVYYYMTQIASKGEEVAVEEPTTSEEESAEIVEEAEPMEYSLAMPNYLTIDTENQTRQELYSKIENVMNQLPAMETEVYEFVVTTEDYSQIDYDKFSDFTGLDLGPQITLNLSNEFSLFLDARNSKIGIAIKIDEGKGMMLSNELEANENNLLTNTQALFLEKFIPDPSKTFSDSQYSDIDIRYVNFDEMTGASIDYAIIDNYFVVGTSKDTMRSIIDKIIGEGEMMERGDVFNTSQMDEDESMTTEE